VKLERLERVPILGIVGLNGSGKTLVAARLGARVLSQGHPVLSSVGVRFGKRHSIDLTSWGQVADFHDGLLILDEVQAMAASRDYASLPSEVVNLLLQLRKRRVRVIWTTPEEGVADTMLRRVTSKLLLMRGLFPSVSKGQMWGRNRLCLGKLYDMDLKRGETGDSQGLVIVRPCPEDALIYSSSDVVRPFMTDLRPVCFLPMPKKARMCAGKHDDEDQGAKHSCKRGLELVA